MIKFCILRLFLILKKINLFNYPNKSLRVLMYHHIPSNNFQNFENQIKLLKKKWTFISPEDFNKILNNKKRINKRYLLLTFDDGFKSNLYVAKKILKKYKIKSIFFIPGQFLKLKKKRDYQNFIKNNLCVKNITGEMQNMNDQDINWLISNGHKIGYHTYSHKNLKKITNHLKLKKEIYIKNNFLKQNQSYKFDSFAFNFGTIDYISRVSLKMVFKYYQNVFTAIRGDNILSSKIIFRDNICPSDYPGDVELYLMGLFDFIYKKQRAKVKKYLN